jgi:hypothetical protein
MTTRDKVVQLRREGHSQRAIARAAGVSQAAVRKHLWKAGLRPVMPQNRAEPQGENRKPPQVSFGAPLTRTSNATGGPIRHFAAGSTIVEQLGQIQDELETLGARLAYARGVSLSEVVHTGHLLLSLARQIGALGTKNPICPPTQHTKADSAIQVMLANTC